MSTLHVVINIFMNGMGKSIYSDFQSIRTLINNFGNRLSNFSIENIIKNLKVKKSNNNKCSQISINTDSELKNILNQLVGVLTAYTEHC